MTISKEEAAESLAAIARSQQALRQAFRAHHGHYHLWLWGGIWIAMAMVAHCWEPAGMQCYSWPISGLGAVGSFLIGFLQAKQVRVPVDRRFVWVCATLIGFGGVWLAVLQPQTSMERLFTYLSLICAQVYVVVGIWFGSYLRWLGLLLAVLLMVGFFFFLPIFWIWVAIFGDGALILSGCYVRFFWR